MPPTACPFATADAPAAVVWSVLDPARLDAWWDARTRSVTPAGPLAVGQRIEARAGPLGLFRVTADVLEVDAAAYKLRLFLRLPLGITNDEHLSLAPLGPAQCRIAFG